MNYFKTYRYSFLFSLLLTTLLFGYQNCGRNSKLVDSAIDRIKFPNPFNQIINADTSAYVLSPITSVTVDQAKPIEQTVTIANYSDEDFLSIVREAIRNLNVTSQFRKFNKDGEAHASTATCGQVITTDTVLSGTLDCSNYAGKYGLILYGNNLTLDGGSPKFKLIFPQGKVGILAYGTNAEVKNVEVSGMVNGMAILVYDSQGARVKYNKTNNNLIGITVYAENSPMPNVEIENNESKNNSLFGIRVNDARAQGKIVNSPKIRNNDLSGSGLYALHLRTDDMTFDSDHNDGNITTGSQSGLYLIGGEFTVKDINFTTAIQKIHIFVAEAEKFHIQNVTFSGPGATQNQEAYGLHIYKTDQVEIQDVTISHYDVGIKVATESNVQTDLSIEDTSTSSNSYAGIIIQAYDATNICPRVLNDVTYASNPQNLILSSGLGNCTQDNGCH